MNTKPWYKSKAMMGSLVATICLVLAALDVGVTEDEQGQIVDRTMQAIEIVLALVATVVAIYGRMKAKTKLTA